METLKNIKSTKASPISVLPAVKVISLFVEGKLPQQPNVPICPMLRLLV